MKNVLVYDGRGHAPIPMDLMFTDREKEISSEGRWFDGLVLTGAHYEINYSSILTKLIQEAGRFCLFYASDLFIFWKAVEESLSEYREEESITYLFGFYESGVHISADVAKAFEQHNYYYFRSVYALEIVKKGTRIHMILRRVMSAARANPDD